MKIVIKLFEMIKWRLLRNSLSSSFDFRGEKFHLLIAIFLQQNIDCKKKSVNKAMEPTDSWHDYLAE